MQPTSAVSDVATICGGGGAAGSRPFLMSLSLLGLKSLFRRVPVSSAEAGKWEHEDVGLHQRMVALTLKTCVLPGGRSAPSRSELYKCESPKNISYCVTQLIEFYFSDGDDFERIQPSWNNAVESASFA